MPSSIGHAAMAILLRPALPSAERNATTVGFAAVAAVVLDIDAIGRLFGGGDVDFMGGHRAITHSVTAAVVIAAIGAVVLVGRRRASSFKAVFPYLAVVIMSHGVLDMFTNYGEGVELLAPFSTIRFASPVQPFIDPGLTEIFILWIPALLLASREAAASSRRRIAAGLTALAGIGIYVLTVVDAAMGRPRRSDELRSAVAIAVEHASLAGRPSRDSTNRLIASAETGAMELPARRGAGRRCVSIDGDGIATSGDVTVGGWNDYRYSWVRGGGKLWWRTSRPLSAATDSVTLIVRAIRIDRSLPSGAETDAGATRSTLRPVSRDGDTLVYLLREPQGTTTFRSGVRVPVPGLWLFLATTGDNWGCFVFRV